MVLLSVLFPFLQWFCFFLFFPKSVISQFIFCYLTIYILVFLHCFLLPQQYSSLPLSVVSLIRVSVTSVNFGLKILNFPPEQKKLKEFIATKSVLKGMLKGLSSPLILYIFCNPRRLLILNFLKLHFIDYAIRVVLIFLLCPHPPSSPHSLRQLLHHFFVSMGHAYKFFSTPHPTLYFPLPQLFCNCLFVLLNLLTSLSIPPQAPPIW